MVRDYVLCISQLRINAQVWVRNARCLLTETCFLNQWSSEIFYYNCHTNEFGGQTQFWCKSKSVLIKAVGLKGVAAKCSWCFFSSSFLSFFMYTFYNNRDAGKNSSTSTDKSFPLFQLNYFHFILVPACVKSQ